MHTDVHRSAQARHEAHADLLLMLQAFRRFLDNQGSKLFPASVLLPYMTPAYAPLCIHLDITDNLHL